jgi:hypothetical protein
MTSCNTPEHVKAFFAEKEKQRTVLYMYVEAVVSEMLNISRFYSYYDVNTGQVLDPPNLVRPTQRGQTSASALSPACCTFSPPSYLPPIDRLSLLSDLAAIYLSALRILIAHCRRCFLFFPPRTLRALVFLFVLFSPSLPFPLRYSSLIYLPTLCLGPSALPYLL